jgi:hypothetical protein
MDTPSLVIVGAPHFFSRTTLRPFGPSVTLTASARVFMPRSRPRRPWFLPAYLLAASWSLMRAGDPATRNVFERHAGLVSGGYLTDQTTEWTPRCRAERCSWRR